MKRSEVKKELTWDLTHLCKDKDDFLNKLENCLSLAKDINKKYKGITHTEESYKNLMEDYADFREKLDVASTFCYLYYSEDGTNEEAMEYQNILQKYLNQYNEALSFMEVELLNLSDDFLKEMEEKVDFATSYTRRIRDKVKHKLTPEVSDALVKLKDILDSPLKLYETSKSADMRFEDFTLNGKTYPLSFGLFEDHYESEPDTDLRREAFERFSEVLQKYSYTWAENFNIEMKKQKALSEIHGYESVFDYLLEAQEVPRDVYEAHIKTLRENLPKEMRKYAKKIKEKYNLKDMTYADLKIPLIRDFDKDISIEEAKEILKEGLSVFGKDYTDEVVRAIEERHIDFAENLGKSTGAFCSSPYGVHGYVLISWTGKMNEVFVLAHELGHANHFRMSYENNRLINSDISLYLVESPSTTNELILASSMLKNAKDEKMKNYIYSQIIERTYYHNYVTHGIEAIFQNEVLKLIDKHENVNAPILNRIFREILEEFWGDDVIINKGAELTWMRQPHYYIGLYSFTYQAGLAIGTEVFKKLQDDPENTINKYKEVLGSGARLTPVEWAKALGVDIREGKSIKNAIEFIGSIIDKIV